MDIGLLYTKYIIRANTMTAKRETQIRGCFSHVSRSNNSSSKTGYLSDPSSAPMRYELAPPQKTIVF